MSPNISHFPVMSESVVNYVLGNGTGTFIDCTFGAGGHSRKLLKSLDKNSTLIAFDIDNESIRLGKELEKEDKRFSIVKLNFSEVVNYWRENRLEQLSGIIFDLGISTMQLKSLDRGFGYRGNSFLDMRMNMDEKFTAADILNSYTRRQLSEVFKKYGDIKDPTRLVNLISSYRNLHNTIDTTEAFRNIVMDAFANKHGEIDKYLRRCFQALRIETNGELKALQKSLDSLMEIMKMGGTVCIITFHSLEENILKAWRDKYCDSIVIQDYHENMTNKFISVINGYIVPDREEIYKNWGSRSSKLWVMRKVKDK